MSWRNLIITNNCKLDYQLGYLVVRGEETTKIHLSEIGLLIIESTAVSLTSYLLCELMKNKIKVVFCDEKRNPVSEVIPYYGSHDTSSKIQKQIEWSKHTKELIWTKIVFYKIKKQSTLLRQLNKDEYQLLDSYLDELQMNDVTNREGHAAKVYFNALFGKDFSRGIECPINAALNYGYSLVLSLINREIVSNGYLTQLGLFHDNVFNQFNLSCDLMEPFRPIVDQKVFDMNPIIFGTEEKHELVSILSREIRMDDRNEQVGNAIKIYIKSVFDALNESDDRLIKIYHKL